MSKKKRLFIKIALGVILLACVVLSVIAVANKDKVTFISEFLQEFGVWAIVIYIAIRVIFTIFFSFVPACSMMFDLICIATFDSYPVYLRFIICFISIILASVAMDLIGRFGGTKAIILLIGEEEYNESLKLVQEKGMIYVPVMYLLPIFPDDGICLVSGACKIKFWLHFIFIFICRGIGCATTIWGLGELVPWKMMYETFGIWGYFEIVTVLAFWVIIMLFIANKLDKFLSKKMGLNKKKENIEQEEKASN